MPKQTLEVLPQHFTIHSFDVDDEIPAEVLASPLYFLGKTPDELSIVVPSDIPLASIDSDTGWRAFEIIGPLHLSMVGIMAEIGRVLANAKVSIFVVSTFDTDFFLLKDKKLNDAVTALRDAGYTVR